LAGILFFLSLGQNAGAEKEYPGHAQTKTSRGGERKILIGYFQMVGPKSGGSEKRFLNGRPKVVRL
jgi:hypothetical protein